MPKLCCNCVRDNQLKSLVREQGEIIECCAICSSTDINAMDCDSREFRRLFRALYRYHFSEWDYNTHMGGAGLEGVLQRENPLTTYSDSWDELTYEAAILRFFDNGYEPYETGISLFAGYGKQGVQNPPLIALKDSISPTVRRMQCKLETMNFFLLEQDAIQLMSDHIAPLEGIIDEGVVMYRSRIGYETRAMPLWSWGDEWEYCPYNDGRISAPPPSAAVSGRLNREGVSYLYLSQNEATAIAEVRPHPGQYVSLGSFVSTKQLRIADFTSVSIRNYCESDKDLEKFVFIKNIDDQFSLPIPPEDREKYLFTQLIADIIRRLDFDGIVYKSSVGPMANVALFDPLSCRFLENSGRVVSITNLEYQHVDLTVLDSSRDYMTGLDGSYLR